MRLLMVTMSLAAAQVFANECEGLSVVDGKVQTAAPLPLPLSSACRDQIAEKLKGLSDVTQVTVAVRTSDKDRVGGKLLASAKAVAAALESALPGAQAGAVAPRAEADEKTSLVITYAQRSGSLPVARVDISEGGLSNGQPVRVAATLKPGAELRVGEDGALSVSFLDGTRLTLEPRSAMKVRAARSAGGSSSLELELLDGAAVVSLPALAEGSSATVSRGDVTAGVLPPDPTLATLTPSTPQASTFRIWADGPQARVQVASGQVVLRTSKGEASVKAGEGAFRAQQGDVQKQPVSLAGPAVRSGLRGALGPADSLSWAADQQAKGYEVEFARNAAFTSAYRTAPAATPSLSAPRLSDGKWFWRVRAVDQNGFWGAPSKVHSFTVAAGGT